MRKNPSYTALLGPTRLLISGKSATYTIIWSYTIIWQVRVGIQNKTLDKPYKTLSKPWYINTQLRTSNLAIWKTQFCCTNLISFFFRKCCAFHQVIASLPVTPCCTRTSVITDSRPCRFLRPPHPQGLWGRQMPHPPSTLRRSHSQVMMTRVPPWVIWVVPRDLNSNFWFLLSPVLENS